MSKADSRAARRERALKMRHRIADRYLNGDEQTAEQVFDALPYSAIPEWHDVERVLEVLSLAGLLDPVEEKTMSEDPGVVAHNAARMRLVNLEEFLDRQDEGEDVDWAEIGAMAEFDGCEDCIVREVLNAGLESLLRQGAIEIKEIDR